MSGLVYPLRPKRPALDEQGRCTGCRRVPATAYERESLRCCVWCFNHWREDEAGALASAVDDSL